MNIDAAFPSKYLKAAELPDEDLTLTIRAVEIESVGRDEEDQKPVLYFSETQKGLVLNKTNATTLKELHGAETNDWPGKKVALFATEVDYAGNQTLAIRIRKRSPKQDAHITTTDLLARFNSRLSEAKALGVDTLPFELPTNPTADAIIAAGKALKAAIDKANEF